MCTLTVNSLEEAKKLLGKRLTSLNNPKVAFIGQRATDALMFTSFMNVDLIICLDNEEIGIPTISLEKILGKKELWYSTRLADLIHNPSVVKQLLDKLPIGSLIIPYASFPALEAFCDDMGYKLLGTRSALRFFENKTNLMQIKNSIGLVCSSKLISKSEVSYTNLAKVFGRKFVIQNSNGSSGTGTFIIENQNDIDIVFEKLSDELIVTNYHDGLTISANFVITDQQILYVSPSVQVIGQPELSVSSSTFCGVDYHLYQRIVSESDKAEIRKIVEKISTYMKQKGYRGVANVNIMLSGKELTDINARFMGSGLLTTLNQIQRGIIPISLLQIMQFLEIDFVMSEQAAKDFELPLNVSMIVQHNLAEAESVALNAPIGRTFYHGSVLDDNGRLLPIYRKSSQNEVYAKCSEDMIL